MLREQYIELFVYQIQKYNIGNTYDELPYRFRNHKYNYYDYINGKSTSCVSIYPYFTKYGIKNFKIVKIKDYIVYRENQKNHKHINAYETLWINKLKCINDRVSFNPLRYNKKIISEKKKYITIKKNKNKKEKINGLKIKMTLNLNLKKNNQIKIIEKKIKKKLKLKRNNNMKIIKKHH
jgi:hypothetical protein